MTNVQHASEPTKNVWLEPMLVLSTEEQKITWLAMKRGK